MHVRMAEVMTGIVLAFVTIVIGQYAYNTYDRNMPAIEWISGKADEAVIKKGQVLHIKYEAIIKKQCPSDLQHFLIAPDGSAPVRYATIPGGYRPASDDKIVIPVQIMIPMEPTPPITSYPVGNYIYRAIATRYCENGVQIDASIPDIKFTLEN